MNPLLAALPALGRAIVGPVVAAVARGATGKELIGMIRQAGQPFSVKNPWGRVLAYAKDAAQYNARLRNINKQYSPNTERLPFAMGDQRRLYSWTVRIDLVDENGDKWEQHLTVSTDNPKMTVQDIHRRALEAYSQGSGDPDLEVLNSVLVGGTRRYDS